MNVLKKILMFLGGVFALIILLVVFLASSSSDFKEEKAPFIADFMADMASDWSLSSVYSRLSNEFIEQASTPSGERAMRQFSVLGQLESIYDLQIENYYSGTDGKTGIFTFKAKFNSGEALVRMTLVEVDGAVKVQAVNITPSESMIMTSPGKANI